MFLTLSLHRIGIGSTHLIIFHLIFIAYKSESALKTIFLVFSLVFNSSCQYIMCTRATFFFLQKVDCWWK